MSCLQVRDFITGTTITMPRGKSRAAAKSGVLDVVRPNSAAAALVADHLARMVALHLKGRPAKRAA